MIASISGPLTSTIMALTRTPTSVDTKARALRMRVAPIEASRTPSQYDIIRLRKGGRQAVG
jgi:hypothetical protein